MLDPQPRVPIRSVEELADPLRRPLDQCLGALRALEPSASDFIPRAKSHIIQLAQAAHSLSVRPERLLVSLKKVLAEHPHLSKQPRERRKEAVAALVTIAINAYYTSP